MPFQGAIVGQGTFEDIAEQLPSSALASKSQAKQGDDDDQQHGVCHNKDSMVRVIFKYIQCAQRPSGLVYRSDCTSNWMYI